MNCFKCKGNLIEKKVNYVVDLENTIIIIKGVPATVCTQCGEQYFNDETAENIEKSTFWNRTKEWLKSLLYLVENLINNKMLDLDCKL